MQKTVNLTGRKIAAIALSAVLLVGGSVAGTMAYLTSTDTVNNTFTVGQVAITLDETDVKLDGTKDTDNRVKANEYKLMPGHTYIKDPMVTVKADSEASYVRMLVKVENIDKLRQAIPAPSFYGEDDVFLLQALCVDEDGVCTWNPAKWGFAGYTTDGNAGVYEFRYYQTVSTVDAADKELEPLFTDITVPNTVDKAHLPFLADVKIVVTAQAIQADGFADADKAWQSFSA